MASIIRAIVCAIGLASAASVTLGCALPSVTLGAKLAWTERSAPAHGDAPAWRASSMHSVAWIAIGYSLQRSSARRAAHRFAPRTERMDASTETPADTASPCALDVACDWEREQRAIELATFMPAIEEGETL